MECAVAHAAHALRLSRCVYEVLIRVTYAGKRCCYRLIVVPAFELWFRHPAGLTHAARQRTSSTSRSSVEGDHFDI